jgi:GINS complex subunit 1
MYGDDALLLVREARRTGPRSLAAYNEDSVRRVTREVARLLALAQPADGRRPTLAELIVSHACIARNRRCLVAYWRHRIDAVRTATWESGLVPPEQIRRNLSAAEVDFLRGYTQSVATHKHTCTRAQETDPLGVGTHAQADDAVPRAVR